MGVRVEKSILPKSLEKALIRDYTEKYGMRPRLNDGKDDDIWKV